MPDQSRMNRAKFRSWHRGTREADYTMGGFFDRYNASWGDAELAWFEALLDEEDVDILAWVFGSEAVPDRFAGEQMELMQRLDYVEIPR